MTSAFHSIAYYSAPQSKFLIMDTLRRVKAVTGALIHLYCNTQQDVDFYRSQNSDDLFDSMSICRTLNGAFAEPITELEGEIQERAQAWELRLGTTYNFLSVANRHLGRGYALGGPGHPRSKLSTETTYLQMLAAYNRTFDYWQDEIDTKGLTLFVGGAREVSAIAQANGIPYRRLVGAKHKNLHYWGENEFNETAQIESAFQHTAVALDEAENVTEAYSLVSAIAEKYKSFGSPVSMVKQIGLNLAIRGYWRLRGYEKAKNYFGADERRMLYRTWRDFRRMTASKTVRLSALEGSPFVFFPLQTEPELSLQGVSPEFFFQHAAIAALSRDLPAGVRLAVKETVVGVGRRPAGFYQQIADLKNVVWLNMLEPGIDVVLKSAAVAVVSGTPGFEAAVNGIPVISFGKHNAYNFLPHVHYTSDLASLSAPVQRIFQGQFDRDQARIDGARYLKAVKDISFDLGSHSHLSPRDYGEDIVDGAATALLDGLGVSETPAKAAAQ